jgi:hypothetical protein
MIKITIFALLLLFLLLPLLNIQQQTVAQAGTNGTNSTNSLQQASGASGTQSKNNNNVNSSTLLTYENPDFGIKMQYPSNWIKLQDNLVHSTIVAFQLIHQNIYDFTNTTLAELDVRVYNAPPNETSAKLNIGQISTNGQVVISNYKNSTTTLGGLPAIKIISYFVRDVTQKETQLWTFVPGKNLLIEVIYIVQPSKYSLYLPIVERMIDSVVIAH